MDIVDKLLIYRESSDIKLLIASDTYIEQQNLNVIVIEILSWLKLEHKRGIWINEGKKTSFKPLKINSHCSWCVDLKRLVIQESLFQRYFEIENGEFGFKEIITEREREVLRKKAYENFVPQKNF